MSFCTDQVLALASGIYDQLNSPPNISVPFISGWITASGGLLGDINNRLNTCFQLSGDRPCITNGFGASEAVIAGLIYEHDYWKRKASEVLQAGGLMWTSIKEGDSSVTRESPTKLAAEYRALHKETQEALYVAVANWKKGATLAAQVQYAPLASYPTP